MALRVFRTRINFSFKIVLSCFSAFQLRNLNISFWFLSLKTLLAN